MVSGVPYQTSVTNPVVFTPQIMNQVQISAATPTLGASNTITVKFVNSVAYTQLGTPLVPLVIGIKLPGSFGKPPGAPNCPVKINNVVTAGITCAFAPGGDLAFTLPSNLPLGTQFELSIDGVINPLCYQPNYQFELYTMSSTFDVERTTTMFSTVGFGTAQLTIPTITQSATFSASLDNIVITINTGAIIVAGSYIKVTLPPTSIIAPSTIIELGNTNWGTATPTVNKLSTTEFTITDGVLANRSPAPIDTIIIGVKSMFNPRGLGSFPVVVDVFSSDGCKYMSATGSIVNDRIQMIQNAVMVIPAAFRNTFQVYNFTVTPSSNSLSVGDMISIELPSGLLLSNNPSCKSHSSNIVSLTCRRVSNTIIAMTPTIDAAAFALNKQLAFSVDKIRNPDAQGAVQGFFFRVTDSSGTVYENYPSVSYTFSDYIVPNTTQAIFLGRRVGEVNTTNLSIVVDTFLAEKTKIIITFSDNFDLSQLITVNSSSVLTNTTAVNATTRQLVLELVASVPANTTLNFSLNMPNPSVQRIMQSDLSIKLETFDGLQIFAVSAIRADNTDVFTCGPFCSGCKGLFSTCTTCDSGYILSAQKTCLLNSVQSEYFPNYVFIGVGLGLTLLMLFVGLICSCRNYWGNLLYSLLKLNFFGFCILWGFTWIKNDVEYNLRIVSFGLAGAHFVLTWIFFGVIRAASNRSKYQERFHKADQTSVELSELNEEETYHNELELDSAFRYMFNSFMVFSLVFSTAIVRWFFSEKGKRKGYFWYFEPKAFVNIRDALECYQILYFVLFMIPFAGLNIYYIYGKSFADWNKYMFEAILLCGLDLLTYLIAYCELANSKRKILEINKYAPASEAFKDKEALPQADQSFSKDKSGALLDETRKDERSVLMDPNDKLKDDQKISTPLLGASKAPTNAMSGTVITTAPIVTHQIPVQDSEKSLKGGKVASNDKVTLNQSNLPSMMFQPRKSVVSVSRTIGDGSRLEESMAKLDRSALRPLVIHPQSSPRDSDTKKDVPKVHPFSLQPSTGGKLLPVEDEINYPSYPADEKQELKKPLKNSVENLSPRKIFESPAQKILGEMNTSPQFVKDAESGDDLLQYPSSNIGASLSHSTIKTPQRSRFRDNQQKRAKANSKQPLEVIQEEEHDPEPSHPQRNPPQTADNRPSEPPKTPVPSKPEQLNGQKTADLQKGRVLDRNDRVLNISRQNAADVAEGVYCDDDGRVIEMNKQENGLLERGLIKDVDGAVFRVRDQDFEELRSGIYLRPDGTVDNVNGQKPIDVDNQELYDRAGNKLDLKTQDPKCFKLSVFKVENNPKPLILESPQVQDKFEIGIITAPDGKDYRIKDQYFDEIQNRGLYRNRNLDKLDFGLPKEEPKEKYVPEDLMDDGVESKLEEHPIEIRDYEVIHPVAEISPQSTSRPYLQRRNTSKTEGTPLPVKHQPIKPVVNDPRPYSALGTEDKPIPVRTPFIQKSEQQFSGIDDDETPTGPKTQPLVSMPNFNSAQHQDDPIVKKKATPGVSTNIRPARSIEPHQAKQEDTLDDARPVDKKPLVSLKPNSKAPQQVEWGKSDSDGVLEETDRRPNHPSPKVGYLSKPPRKPEQPIKPTQEPAEFTGLDDDIRSAPIKNQNKPQSNGPQVQQSVKQPNAIKKQEHPKVLAKPADFRDIPEREVASPVIRQQPTQESRQQQVAQPPLQQRQPQEQTQPRAAPVHQIESPYIPPQASRASQPPHSRPTYQQPTLPQPQPQAQPQPQNKSKQQATPQNLHRFDPFQNRPPPVLAEQDTMMDRTPLWPSAQNLYKTPDSPVLRQPNAPAPNKPRPRELSQQYPGPKRPVERAVDDDLDSKGSQDSRTMYLDLMMDESLDIDVNIEEVDDDRESAGANDADRYSYAQSGRHESNLR